MDPKFRSSFIPKKPLSPKAEGGVTRKRTSFNLMTFSASVIFVIAIAAAGGVFGYKFILDDRVNQKGLELKEARELINLEQIDEFKLFDERLQTASRLLRNHKVTSAFFDFLQESTLHNVQFEDYFYEADTRNPNDLAIVLEGRSSSIESLALQADVLRNQTLISDVNVLDVQQERKREIPVGEGDILFVVEAKLNAKEVAFLVNEEESIEE